MVAIGSLAVLVVDHRRLEATFEATIAATDNLSHARLHATQALLALEGLRAGDPTLSASRPVSDLDQAISLLGDFREGRSSLLGMDPRPVDARLVELVSGYAAELQVLRGEVVGGALPASDPVERRLRISRLRETAEALERQTYDVLRERLDRENLRHRFRLGAWTVFITVVGGIFTAALRARDRSEEALRAAERGYAALATHAAAGLVRTDQEGLLLETTGNWEDLFEGEVDRWVGRLWWEILPETERRRTVELWMSRAARGDTFFLHLEYKDSDGKPRHLASRWAPDLGEGHRSSGSWVGTFIDETEHRSVQDQLRQTQRLEAVGRLTSGIAHDFNNLLGIILANVELLKGVDGIGAEARELVDEVDAATRSGRELVAGLSVFSRRSSIEMDTLDLGEVAREGVQLARRLLPASVDLKIHISDPAPLVSADRGALQQILLNLVSNARDAMPAGGRLTVEVDAIDVDVEYREAHPAVELGSFGRITVTDTGAGMDSATLTRAFDPFFTTKEEGKGTGLGLSMVFGLVRQHGGHVHAYSEPGAGSTFRVYIPRATLAARPVAAEAPSPVRDPLNLRTLDILFVEDDDALRHAAQRMLVRLGHRVVAASNGREALQILEHGHAFDLIVADVDMDEMGGFELFETVNARGYGGAFVFTSGYSAKELRAQERIPARARYLPKPWTVEDLERVLDALPDEPPSA